jgi:hypothetical protein
MDVPQGATYAGREGQRNQQSAEHGTGNGAINQMRQ